MMKMRYVPLSKSDANYKNKSNAAKVLGLELDDDYFRILLLLSKDIKQLAKK